MKEKGDIGDFFKENLESMEVKGNSSDWIGLEMKLEEKQFSRFSFNKFNVYYAGCITFAFVFSTAVFVDHFFVKGNKTETASIQANLHKQPAVNLPADTMSKAEFLQPENQAGKEKAGSVSAETSSHKLPGSEGLEKTDLRNGPAEFSSSSAFTSLKEDSARDTSSLEQVKVQPAQEKKPAKKKVIYITRQDTVVVIDTVQTNKRRK